MSYTRLFSILLLLCARALVGAQTVELVVKTGTARAALALRHGNLPVYVNNISTEEGISATVHTKLHLKSGFWVGAASGLNSTISNVHFVMYPNVPKEELTYWGAYRVNQYYVAVIPEYHILEKWVYVNAGVGFFGNFDRQFTRGSLNREPAGLEGSGESFARKNYWGYCLGVGICPPINNNLSLILEGNLFRAIRGPETNAVVLEHHYSNINIGFAFKFLSKSN